MTGRPWRSPLFVGMLVACGLSGCVKPEPDHYAENVLNRPLPTTQDERQRECAALRTEIARQQSLAQMGYAVLQDPILAAGFQGAANNHVAALESRAANIQCTAAFSSAASVPTGQSFDQCFARCTQLTSRTKEQCFDSCNH